MKRNIHPKSRDVVFVDVKTGTKFFMKSTVETAETILWEDGKEYPVVKAEITSDSHPAYGADVAPSRETPRGEQFAAKYGTKLGRTAVH
jgi:large subunit ribosomal protein L31